MSSTSSIPMTPEQLEAYNEMYEGMADKQPEFTSDLTKAEMTKVANTLKKRKKEDEKRVAQEVKAASRKETMWEHVMIDGDGNPRAMPTIENLEILLDKLGFTLKYNSMTNKIEFERDGKKITDEFDDIYPLIVSHAVVNDLPRESIQSYIPAVAKKIEYHPVVEILNGKEWDGITRIDDVISSFSFVDEKFSRMIMRKFFIGAIAAIYYDDFFTKMIPILQGDQSYRKTAALGRIFNVIPHAWLEGHALKETSKDSVMEAVSCWCCELGEIETTTKGEQGWLKAFLPKSKDTYRPPYGRGAITRSRKSVFAGTVNTENFLKDETGSTRFSVLALSKVINMEQLNKTLGWKYENDKVIRTSPELLIQFWLEIKHYFDSGEGWMLSDEEQATALTVNDKFEDRGEYHNVIIDHIEKIGSQSAGTTFEWMTATQLCEFLRIPTRLSRRMGRNFTELLEFEVKRNRVKFYKVPVMVTKSMDM